jgi:hypothetical protein
VRLLDSTTPAAGGVELTLAQISEHHLELMVGTGRPQRVRIIRSREEDRYLGIGAPAAAARRAPVAAPTLSRRQRPATEQGRATPPPPRRAPRVVTPEQPGLQRVPVANGRGPGNGDGGAPVYGDAGAGGGRRRMEGPRRMARGTAGAPAQPASRRPQRNFNLPEGPQLDPVRGRPDGESEWTHPAEPGRDSDEDRSPPPRGGRHHL